jgi:hypothetical protein
MTALTGAPQELRNVAVPRGTPRARNSGAPTVAAITFSRRRGSMRIRCNSRAAAAAAAVGAAAGAGAGYSSSSRFSRLKQVQQQ